MTFLFPGIKIKYTKWKEEIIERLQYEIYLNQIIYHTYLIHIQTYSMMW